MLREQIISRHLIIHHVALRGIGHAIGRDEGRDEGFACLCLLPEELDALTYPLLIFGRERIGPDTEFDFAQIDSLVATVDDEVYLSSAFMTQCCLSFVALLRPTKEKS